jgi:hypothetical protein
LDWAADFQKLHLSEPSQYAPQHNLRAGIRSAGGGWQDEFIQQQRAGSAQKQQPMLLGVPQGSNSPMSGALVPTSSTYQGNLQVGTETFDDSAFEAAFAQARAEVELQERTSAVDHIDAASGPLQTDMDLPVEQPESIKIGSDTIPHVEQSESQGHKADSDELARTAGQLLEKLNHEQSQKFKESSFLALMRRIRDREVHIEGDEFREVSTTPRDCRCSW